MESPLWTDPSFSFMRHTLFYIFFFIAFALQASSIDNFGRIKMARNPSVPLSRGADMNYTGLIVEIEDEDGLEELFELGAVVPFRRDNLLLTYVPTVRIDELAGLKGVRNCAVARQTFPSLDMAVKATHADNVKQGIGFDSPFTGKGIVVGFSDIGFDAGHAAFADRVSAIVHVVDTTASIINTTPQSGWTTDSYDEFHATHVAGILAGNDVGATYKGIAVGADLVATTSLLDDASILVGVESIIEYAKSQAKPAVINLSLGSNFGPHDGTDLFCRYLDRCAEDAAILLAAGNDGASLMHASDKGSLSVMVDTYDWDNIMSFKGYIDIWNSTSNPLDVRIRIWDDYEKQFCYEGDWCNPVSDLFELELPDFFEGEILAAAEQNTTNGRYNTTVGLKVLFKDFYPGYSYSKRFIVLDVRSVCEDDFIEVFTGGKLAFFRQMDKHPWRIGGDTNQTVSSLACGHNVICVGSATTRDKTPLLNGPDYSWENFVTSGTVSNFSSYGTTFDGRSLPHFCAPGAFIVSAYNRYVTERHPELKSQMSAQSASDPNSYYYAECGTSMATPHAAGIFALWLEANPALTGEELRRIAIETASVDGVDPNNPRTGAGMIDAAAGLRYILNKQGVSDAVTDNLIKVWRDGKRLAVSGAAIDEAFCEIYSFSGIRIDTGSIADIILPDTPFIVRITTPSFSITRKIN